MESSTSFNDVVITILEKVVAGVFDIDNVLSVMMVSSARFLATTAIKTKKKVSNKKLCLHRIHS